MSYQFKKVNNKSKQTYNLWFLLMTHCSFECSKNKRDYYRGEVCIKTCNFEKLKMSPLTDKKKLCKKKKKNSSSSNKKYDKVRDHCHYTGKNRGTAHNICNL